MQFGQLIDLLEYSCLDQQTAVIVARDEMTARLAVFTRLDDMQEAMKAYSGSNDTQACKDIVSWIKNAQQYRSVRVHGIVYGIVRTFVVYARVVLPSQRPSATG
jgi:hypothetical protein